MLGGFAGTFFTGLATDGEGEGARVAAVLAERSARPVVSPEHATAPRRIKVATSRCRDGRCTLAPYPSEHEGSMRTDAEPIGSGSGQREAELASLAGLRLGADRSIVCYQDLSVDRQAEFNPQSERLTHRAV